MKPSIFAAVTIALGVALSSAPAQFVSPYTNSTTQPIPTSGTGGAPGGALNPANQTSLSVVVPRATTVAEVRLDLDITHTAVGNLRLELEHCGTIVPLYARSPNTTGNLNGVYRFQDNAPTTFASAVTAAGNGGVVVPNAYAPASPLAAFSGMNAAGTWTVTVFDLAAGDSGVLAGMTLTLIEGALYPAAGGPSVNIPDGLNGDCVAPVTKAIAVPTHGTIDDVVVRVTMAHTFVSDLDITIQHGSTTVFLSQWSAPTSGANVFGAYAFWDGASTAWTAIETATPTSAFIPSGTYRPNQPLSAFKGADQFGPWYLTVCDRGTNDVGALDVVSVEIGHSQYALTMTQPNGAASVTLVNSGGVPGDTFINLFTLAPGSYPFGWLDGLDITISDLVAQVQFGSPFTGTLDPCGSASVTVGGPIPSGLTVWGVSYDIDATGSPRMIKRAFTYTTQ